MLMEPSGRVRAARDLAEVRKGKFRFSCGRDYEHEKPLAERINSPHESAL